MISVYKKFESELVSKLNDTHIGLVVMNAKGSFDYANLEKFTNKDQILGFAFQTIQLTSEVAQKLQSDLPEYLLFKGSKAFLVLVPSLVNSHFYGVFGDNGLNVGMARVCLQNMVREFEIDKKIKA